MASYESYLKELGHTADNVVTEKIAPFKNEIKSLSEELERQKQKNSELSADIKKQSDENNRLKEELSVK